MELTQSVDQTLEATLSPLVERRQQLKAEASRIEKELDTLNDTIKTTLVGAGIEPVENEVITTAAGYELVLNLAAEKSTLDKQMLLLLGVSTEQLKKATKVSTSMRLDIRKVKQ